MTRIYTILAVGLLIGQSADAQVTCTRVGDQTFCNGSLQQARPSQPPTSVNPFGSYDSGYKKGALAELTDLYFAGKISPEKREMFLADVAENGGDATWFRNDMAIKDQQQRSESSATSSVQAGQTKPQAGTPTVTERLKELDALLKSGAVSQTEYDAKRREILNSL